MKSIDNYKVISTKKGDKGTSKNFSNDTLLKTDILFDTIGSIDELTSYLGITYHYINEKDVLRRIQTSLQNIMSIIATNPNSKQYSMLNQVSEEDVLYLEFMEQEFLKQTNIKPVFVLPGSDSTKGSAFVDYSRSLTRRCERMILKFEKENERADLDYIKKYMNRLSDLLYILARTYDE